jgi:DNA-binding NarL/FixJ family response regulator
MKSKQKTPRTRSSSLPVRRRILIVDDHPITRYGLTQLLNHEPDLIVCGEADSAQRAFSAIKPPLPDVVVADLGMPGKSVIELLKDLRALYPDLPVLILSTHDESIYAERLVRAGARGYIMKSEGGANLLKAIRQVLQGQPYLSPALAAKAFETFGRGRVQAADSMLSQLTDREFEVFQLLGEGKTNREVAEQLSLSPKTVEVHRLSLFRKLHLKSAAQLIRYAVAYQQGSIQPR